MRHAPATCPYCACTRGLASLRCACKRASLPSLPRFRPLDTSLALFVPFASLQTTKSDKKIYRNIYVICNITHYNLFSSPLKYLFAKHPKIGLRKHEKEHWLRQEWRQGCTKSASAKATSSPRKPRPKEHGASTSPRRSEGACDRASVSSISQPYKHTMDTASASLYDSERSEQARPDKPQYATHYVCHACLHAITLATIRICLHFVPALARLCACPLCVPLRGYFFLCVTFFLWPAFRGFGNP